MEEMDVKQIKHTAAQNIIISEVKNCLGKTELKNLKTSHLYNIHKYMY